MTKRAKKEVVYNERARLRSTILPDLQRFNSKPTLAATTMTEVTDLDVGLKPDEIAQETAERLIRAAISYWMKQASKAEATRASRQPSIVIAADELKITVDVAQGIVDQFERLTSPASGFASHQSKPGEFADLS